MRCLRIIARRFGGPEVLEAAQEEVPEPGRGEVRVRELAAGVSFADLLMREGIHPEKTTPPFTPGWDIVGVVEKTGEGVSQSRVGQMVAALPIHGGYAQYICLPEDELTHVPAGLDPASGREGKNIVVLDRWAEDHTEGVVSIARAIAPGIGIMKAPARVPL